MAGLQSAEHKHQKKHMPMSSMPTAFLKTTGPEKRWGALPSLHPFPLCLGLLPPLLPGQVAAEAAQGSVLACNPQQAQLPSLFPAH